MPRVQGGRGSRMASDSSECIGTGVADEILGVEVRRMPEEVVEAPACRRAARLACARLSRREIRSGAGAPFGAASC